MRKVRLGIIGCGIATQELHWPALKTLGDYFEITAVCNRTAPKAKKFAKMAGDVPYTLDYKELLRRDDVDAVTVSVPIALNRRITEDALKADKHVLVEKPLAANLAQAEKMLEFPARYRQVMMVAENFRYRPSILKMKKLIDAQSIGRPHTALWNMFFSRRKNNKFAQTKWRQHPQHVGASITDGGVHHIAALRMVAGEIVGGCAWSQSINAFLGKPDMFSFQFETDKKVKGVLNFFVSATGLREDKLSVIGTKGTLVLENMTITLKRDGRPDKITKVDDSGGYREEFLAFYDLISKKVYSAESFIEAYNDLHILISVLKAAR